MIHITRFTMWRFSKSRLPKLDITLRPTVTHPQISQKPASDWKIEAQKKMVKTPQKMFNVRQWNVYQDHRVWVFNGDLQAVRGSPLETQKGWSWERVFNENSWFNCFATLAK